MKIYRKRFIPDEIVDISNDEVIKKTDDLIITKWIPIKPREDIGSGVSYTFFKEGYKISKFYNKNGEFLFWYCDIIDYEYNKEQDIYTFIDLLVDIKIYPDKKMELLDFGELQEAYDNKLISGKILLKAINNLNKLVTIIEEDGIESIIDF